MLTFFLVTVLQPNRELRGENTYTEAGSCMELQSLVMADYNNMIYHATL